MVEKTRGERGCRRLNNAGRNNNMEVCKIMIGQIADKEPINNFVFFLMILPPPRSTLFPYTTLFRSLEETNPSDNDGNTPLHCAVRNFSLEICKLLCQNSNNKNPKNDRGKTPLDLAFERKDPKIYRFFKSRASKI